MHDEFEEQRRFAMALLVQFQAKGLNSMEASELAGYHSVEQNGGRLTEKEQKRKVELTAKLKA